MQEQEEQQTGNVLQDAGPAVSGPVVDGGRRAGFTLIELMVTVLIISILTRLALPYFQNQIRESRRSDAKTALLDLASREERYYATNSMYTSSWANLFASGFTGTSLYVPNGDSATATYRVDFNGSPTATSFALTATPQSTDQAKDYCGTYTLNNFGDQGNTGNTITTGCW